MNKINHHLTDQLLIGYSAGALPEAFSLVVATHLSLCDECRARAEGFDGMGGALLEQAAEESATMSAGSFDAALEKARASQIEVAAPKPADPVLPEPLAAYVGKGLSDIRWRSIGMGVKQAILPTSRDASARLLYIPAGTAVPDHGHRGTELTLVLQGAFQDEDGRFGRGDVEVANEEVNHTPIADLGEDCICLAATDAPLRFNGFIPRLVQPFFRI